MTAADQNDSASQPKPPPSRDPWGLLLVFLASVYIVWAVLQAEPLQSANDRSRWATVWSLVERGTYQIDEIDGDRRFATIDKVRHRSADDQPYHFYSSKPPLFPTMVAGLYWVQKSVFGYDLKQHTAQVTRITLIIVNAIPMILGLFVLRNCLRRLQVSRLTLIVVLLAAGFGSMLNPFLTTLNNHTPGAVCLLFSLVAMIRILRADRNSGRQFAFFGFFAAFTCCFELPAALFGVASFLFAVAISWKLTARWYVPAAIIPLAAFFITNVVVTGGIKPFYAYYGTDKYVYEHEGVPSYWSSPKGIDANDESPAVYLFHCVLGHHGILSLTPVFVLTLAGWYFCLHRKQRHEIHIVGLLGMGISAVVLLFYLSRTQNYNYGGNSSALRWMLWLTPFWWFGMVPSLERLSRVKAGFILPVLLLVPSIYSSVYSLTTPWKPNWIFVRMQEAGWIDYSTRYKPFNPPRYALLNQIPQEPTTGTFQGGTAAENQILEWSTRFTVTVDGKAASVLDVRLTETDAAFDTAILVLRDGPESGQDIATWVYLAPSDVVENQQIESQQLQSAPSQVVEILRGLPSRRSYNIASPRYLKYERDDGEKSAIECQRAASRVAFEHPEYGRCWHRCDVYYSNEVPFGVAQWWITITQDGTNKLIRKEHWLSQDLP